MASFTSSIGTAIYQVLFVVYSYPNDDTETATFDLTVLILYPVARVHNRKREESIALAYHPCAKFSGGQVGANMSESACG